MSIRDLFKPKEMEKRNAIGLFLGADDGDLECAGYTSLADNPEIFTACRRIAMLISSMPIMLMENSNGGDIRIHNELSRKLDIEPNSTMTRRTWMEAIIMNLLLYGRGNSVATVQTDRGYLGDITPIPASMVSFNPNPVGGYTVFINGKAYDPNELLHFVDNPDRNYPWKGKGLTVLLSDVANNLKQANKTKKGFMSSKWKPSIIVKVDAMIDEFSTPAGRQKLLDDYARTSEAGEPWLIPAEQFDVEQVRPLSLADLAISDSMSMDKKTVAAIIGVPAFLLGVGEYNQSEWNAFVSTHVREIAMEIEQELTRKLILNPKWYVKFNILSLMNWDISTIADVYCKLADRGYVDGNEVRDRIGMSPRDGLDELRVLENYIPVDKAGDQLKLVQNND